MHSVSGVRPRQNIKPAVLEQERRHSELPPRTTPDPHAKVIKTKKSKGVPCDPETLLGIINLFREQYGQQLLEIDEDLAPYCEAIANGEDCILQNLGNQIVLNHTVICEKFTGQSAINFMKSWLKSSHTLNSLLSPANYGYASIVDVDEETRKLVFINVLTFK